MWGQTALEHLKKRLGGYREGGSLMIIERRWLTPRAAVCVVEFEGARLLLGVTERGIAPLMRRSVSLRNLADGDLTDEP
jgi:flagellar biogenesis protein FliO